MTALTFKTISLKNIMSFGNCESVIDLQDQGTVTITGENRDNGGANGAGKTTIINAICYVLYNKPFDNISLQRLINSTNATKNTQMEVRLTFDKGEDEYEIFRSRGSEITIEVLKNGVDITPGKGVYEIDALVLSIIGISYELFTKMIIFSGNSPAFLQLPMQAQRVQIEELLNITMLSDKAKILKEQIKQTDSDIKVAEAVVKQQQAAFDLHVTQVEQAEQRVARWEKTRLSEIEEITATLKRIEDVDFDGEQLLHDEKARLLEVQRSISSRLIPLQKDRKTLDRDVEKLLSEQEHLEEAKCPYCTQAFADAPAKLKAILENIESQGAKLITVDEQIILLEAEQKEQTGQFELISSLIMHPDLKSLIAARSNSEVMRGKMAELSVAVNPHEEALESLINCDIAIVDTARVDELKRRSEHQAFLLKLLTDKNSFIRRRIINQSIPVLNSRLNHHTDMLGLPHVVKFDADMSCTVTEYGRELDFGNLSAGEKKRVNTAMAMSFRDVYHQMHTRTNLLLVDELDGALDVPGIEMVVKMLKGKARDEGTSIFVISHHPSVHGRLDRDLLVVKENGFSTAVLGNA